MLYWQGTRREFDWIFFFVNIQLNMIYAQNNVHGSVEFTTIQKKMDRYTYTHTYCIKLPIIVNRNKLTFYHIYLNLLLFCILHTT